MAKRTIENCTLIKRMVRKDIDEPHKYNSILYPDGVCDGYLTDEEPHEICDKCKLCTSYEEGTQ